MGINLKLLQGKQKMGALRFESIQNSFIFNNHSLKIL